MASSMRVTQTLRFRITVLRIVARGLEKDPDGPTDYSIMKNLAGLTLACSHVEHIIKNGDSK